MEMRPMQKKLVSLFSLRHEKLHTACYTRRGQIKKSANYIHTKYGKRTAAVPRDSKHCPNELAKGLDHEISFFLCFLCLGK